MVRAPDRLNIIRLQPMQIVLAVSADIEGASEVLRPLDTPYYQFSAPNEIAHSIHASMCWIARTNDQIVGALVAREVEGSFEIVALAIVPSYQRKSIGRDLLQAAETAARERRFPKIWCWALARYSSQNFYKSNGFTEAFLLRRQFYGEDCWFLGKFLIDG